MKALTRLELLGLAERYHRENPGCWLRTNRDITEIMDIIRDPKRDQPLDGKMWWRTQHLVRHLGGVA